MSRLACAPRSADRSSAPQVRPVSRVLALRKVPTRNMAVAVSVAIATMPVAFSGNPFSASRDRKLGVEMDHRGAAFRLRQHDGVGRRGHDRIEIAVNEAGVDRIHAHQQARAVLWPRARFSGRRARSCARPPCWRRKSESSRSTISASAPLAMPLSSFFGLSPGTKRRERKAYAGRLSMKACRRHSATSLSFWL